MCLEKYGLDPANFLSSPVWQAALKKNILKLDLLTDIDMLLMVDAFIRGGIRPAIH